MQTNTRNTLIASGLVMAGVSALVAAGAWLMRRGQQRPAPTIREKIRVGCPPSVAMAVWADGERLAEAMEHADAERYEDAPKLVHWEQQGPFGMWVRWDAKVHVDRDRGAVVWETTDDSPVHASGTIDFVAVDGGDATEIVFETEYEPPMGLKAVWPAMLQRMIEERVSDDLERVQAHLEQPHQEWH